MYSMIVKVLQMNPKVYVEMLYNEIIITNTFICKQHFLLYLNQLLFFSIFGEEEEIMK